jgi:hypothetical protein
MKKFILFLLAILFIFSSIIPAYADSQYTAFQNIMKTYNITTKYGIDPAIVACENNSNCYNALYMYAKKYHTTVGSGKYEINPNTPAENTNSSSSSGPAPKTSSAAKPDTNASVGTFSSWLQKTITNPNGISTVPEDIWGTTGLSGTAELAPFMEKLGYAILIFSFIFNLYMNLYRYSVGLESQAKPYFHLFFSFILSASFIYAWSYNSGGSGNIFYEYLSVINNMYNSILNGIMGASIIVGLLHNIHHTTTVITNEVHNTKTGGWSWNPLSWASAAVGAVVGYLIKSIGELIITIALDILYFLYLIISYLVYLVQLFFLGTLYAVFPIILGVNLGDYAKDMKVLQNWTKWFVEVSFWGIFISLEFTIFAYIVGNHFADSNSIISPLTAVLLLIVMTFLPLAGPILIHKILGLHSASGNANLQNHIKGITGRNNGEGDSGSKNKDKAKEAAKAIATGGASIPADMVKDGLKKGVQEATNSIKEQGGTSAGGIAPGASTKRNTQA